METRLRWCGVAIAVILLAVILLAGCATVPAKPATSPLGDYGYTREYVSWLIRDEMAKNGVTGLSIALVDDQKVVWAEGFGYADKAKGVRATADTIYRAGSLAELFTATAVMQLADDKNIDIDQPLKSYLPEFSVKSRFPYAPPITPRTILTHHSGLPAVIAKGMWTRNPEAFEEEVRLLGDEYVATLPDYVFSPSSVGMTLLGHTIEKVAGRDFTPYMDLALFLPLRMTSSSFSPRIDRSPNASKAYANGEEAEEAPLRDVPAAGLNSTVNDLSRFLSSVFAGGWAGDRQILRPGTLAEMLRPQNDHVPLDLTFRVGLGWLLGGLGGPDVRNCGPVAHHSGATLYHRSQIVILPEQKLGVVVLANSPSAAAVVDRVAAETLKRALEAKVGIVQPLREARDEKEASPPGKEAVKQVREGEPAVKNAEGRPKSRERNDGAKERRPVKPEELVAFEGRYATIAGVVPVKSKGDYLEAELFGRTVRLVPRPDGLLGVHHRFLSVFPVSLGELDDIGIERATVDGRDIVKGVQDGQELLLGERLEPAALPKKWGKRAGRYEIADAGDDILLLNDIRLRSDDGFLTLQFVEPLSSPEVMTFALAPVSEEEAVIRGLGRREGETVRAVTVRGEELLVYSGYLLRRKGE